MLPIVAKHPEFTSLRFPKDSIVIDPWRYLPPQDGVELSQSVSASSRNVLNLAYTSLKQDDSNTCTVGQISDRADVGYLWHYWIPWMAMADRPHLQLHPLERVLVEGSRFVFPLELRWEFIEWFAGGKATSS